MDDEFEFLKNKKWFLSSNGYVISSGGTEKKYLQHFILGQPSRGKETDHINRNKFDNRKINLRFVTKSQNQCNRKHDKDSFWKLKGVSQDKRDGKFRARIGIRNREIGLGYFDTAKEAHEAYKKAAKKYHGEFACW